MKAQLKRYGLCIANTIFAAGPVARQNPRPLQGLCHVKLGDKRLYVIDRLVEISLSG